MANSNIIWLFGFMFVVVAIGVAIYFYFKHKNQPTAGSYAFGHPVAFDTGNSKVFLCDPKTSLPPVIKGGYYVKDD